jgi:TM2 domain-containing membrane protein YozV
MQKPNNFVESQSHDTLIAYLIWFVWGIFGGHRFYLGRPFSGFLYLCTLGFLGIGWIIDAFFLPSMCQEASRFYVRGKYDYNVAWLLLGFLGLLGIHRLYMGKVVTGVIFMFTGALLGLGLLFDVLTLNEQINNLNKESL